MNNPLITIIVPVYNVEKYLRKCIDSIIGQSYTNLEIILVDDGSPDGSPAICDEYSTQDERIRTVHRANGGQSAARNSGLSIMKGEYVTFVDSDDYVSPDYIEFLYKLLVENNADISQCGHYIVFSEPRQVNKYSDHGLVLFDKKQAIESLCYNGIYDVTAWNKLYKADLYHEIRFPEGRIYEDTAVSHLVAERAKKIAIQMIPKYFYIQRYNSTANGLEFNERKYQFLQAGDELADWVTEHYLELTDAANVKRVFARLSTLSQLVNCNHYDKKRIAEMMAVIKKYRGGVLRDHQVSKRDKLGILSISLGYPVYWLLWKIYYTTVRRK
jgi:glycosyltransferase involved in cell wall biosynthesis